MHDTPPCSRFRVLSQDGCGVGGTPPSSTQRGARPCGSLSGGRAGVCPFYFFTRTRVVAGFHFRNISIRCEQACSDSPLATGAGSATKGGVAMSESDQFRQYAEEAMLWVSRSKNEEEKQILVELLCTWTAAAVASDRIGVLSGSTPEPRAP